MRDEESQQAFIPKDYGTALSTVPVSADAGGSARRVVIIALAAIALFASGVAVGSSTVCTPGFAAMCQDTKGGDFNSLTTQHYKTLCIFCTPNVAAFCQTTNPN